MPSAATAKLEKQASTEAVDPIRQAIIMLEHKIRNLEKRKRKIETYREEQTLGKDLNTDQLNAISKYNEVLQTLDFARDLCKQIHVVASDAAKQQKKQARKEAQEKAQQELAKVKEILIVQEVLQNMGLENIREDFRTGQNGAAQLSDEDLKYLDDLYTEVSAKHGSGQSVSFQAQLQLSAEHLISVVEGKQKEFVGTTYCKLKEIIATIISCGYFDQALEVVGESEESPVAAAEEVPANVEPVGDAISYPPEEQPKAPVIEATPSYVPAPAVSVPAAAQMPPQVPNPTVVPTPVAAVESSYFSTAAPTFVPAQPQAPRPLNEVIGSVSSTFNFLQESELDTPDLSVILTTTPTQHGTPPPAVPVAVAPIQTQTFTNQNFAAVSTAPVQHQVQVVFQASSEISQAHIPGFATGTPNPPPPIPMPPSHQQQQAVQPAVVQQFTTAPPPQTPVVTYASQAQQQIKQEVPPADVNEVKTEQKVPVTTMPEAEWTADNSGGGDYASNDNQSAEWSSVDNPGDWNQQSEGNQSEEWYSVSQGDNYATQGGARNYGGRGGRGGRGSGGRGSSNGYSGRGRGSGGNYQNGRGGGSGGYGNYRNNEGGNNNFYQNGYQQRDNFNNSNYGGGYKRGGRGGTGAPRGGTGQRGGTGNRGGNNPRGRGGNFMRGGGKQ